MQNFLYKFNKLLCLHENVFVFLKIFTPTVLALALTNDCSTDLQLYLQLNKETWECTSADICGVWVMWFYKAGHKLRLSVKQFVTCLRCKFPLGEGSHSRCTDVEHLRLLCFSLPLTHTLTKYEVWISSICVVK